MDKSKLNIFSYFPSFQDKDSYFQSLIDDQAPFKKIFQLYFLLNMLTVLYGLSMGSYHGFLQAVASAVKVPVLFSLSLLICFPVFFVIQLILGSKLKLKTMISVVLSGLVLTSAIMISFVPIIVFFLLTGGNYYFLQLLHIGIFIFSGFFGTRLIVEALKYSCENKNIYPRIGVEVFRFWVIILAFVAIQLAWNLRPFLGDRNEDFKLFRDYEGNFYTALVYSAQQLLSTDDNKTKHNPSAEIDSVYLFNKIDKPRKDIK